MQKRNYTRMIVEAGIMIGLAYVLNLFSIFKMPQGGSVTAGSMIPIFIYAYRWGFGPGLLAGGVFGLMQLLLGGYILTPIQALLDYPIAFMAIGLAGLFASKDQLTVLPVFAGVLLGGLVRFMAHVLTGVIFFAEYAPEGMNPWWYSVTYNGSYMAVELLITIVVIVLLGQTVKKEMVLQN